MTFQQFYMNAAELLDTTVAIYKKSFAQQMTVTAVMMVVSAIIMLLVMGMLAVAGVVGFMNDFANQDFTPRLIAFIGIAVVLVIIVSSLLSSVQSIANMSLARQTFGLEKPNVSKAFSDAIHSIFPVFTTLMALFILYIPVLAIVGAMFYGIFASQPGFLTSAPYSLYMPSYLMSLFSSMLGVILLIYLLTLFIGAFTYAAVPAALFEKRYFFGAIGRSIRLVKNDYWQVLGVILLDTASVFGITYGLTSVFGLIQVIAGIIGGFTPSSAMPIVSVAYIGRYASLGLGLLMAPLRPIFMTLLYTNQRIKHEGLDIEIALENLTSAQKGG